MIGAAVDRLNLAFDRRCSPYPGWVVVVQVFLGVGWLRSAVAKLADPDWWTGRVLADFVSDHQQDTIYWYEPLLDLVVADLATGWASVILLTEILIAVSLLTSVRLRTGLAAAVFLNLNFLLVGSTNPSIFYLILELVLILWMVETSAQPRSSLRWSRVMVVGGLTLMLACAPFLRTIDPDAVMEDPAAVLATWSALGAVGAATARRRVRRDLLQTEYVDVRRESVPV